MEKPIKPLGRMSDPPQQQTEVNVFAPQREAVPTLMCSPFDLAESFTPPARSYEDDAGFDLVVVRFVPVNPKQTVRLPHNLVLAPPPGYYCTIVPRSSTIARLGLIVLQGLVDPGYRGEVQTVVYNPKNVTVQVNIGDRVSQLLMQRQHPMAVDCAASLEEILRKRPGTRGAAGFGSSEVRRKG